MVSRRHEGTTIVAATVTAIESSCVQLPKGIGNMFVSRIIVDSDRLSDAIGRAGDKRERLCQSSVSIKSPDTAAISSKHSFMRTSQMLSSRPLIAAAEELRRVQITSRFNFCFSGCSQCLAMRREAFFSRSPLASNLHDR